MAAQTNPPKPQPQSLVNQPKGRLNTPSTVKITAPVMPAVQLLRPASSAWMRPSGSGSSAQAMP